jgi:GWxTD domain-containing protein
MLRSEDRAPAVAAAGALLCLSVWMMPVTVLGSGRLPFGLLIRGLADPDGGVIEVVAKVPRAEMDFVRMGDGFQGVLELYATVHDPNGDFVADGTRRVDRRLRTMREEAWEGLFETPRIELHVPPGRYSVEVVMKAPESGRTNAVTKEVEVPSFPSNGIALSSPVIMSFSEVDSGFVADPQPGSSGGFSGPALIMWEVYAAPGHDSSKVAVVASVEGEEGGVPADTFIVELRGPVTEGRWEADLSLLAAGTYATRIEAGEQVAEGTFEILWSIQTLVVDKDDGLRLLEYFGTHEDEKRFKKLEAAERHGFWEEFWGRHDPVPGTPRNEFKDAIGARIRYANDRFGSFMPGWKTDRGMVYVILGAPDEIERHPFEVGSKPYEIWSYYSYRVQYLFVDWRGFGNYELYQGPQPQRVLRQRG